MLYRIVLLCVVILTSCGAYGQNLPQIYVHTDRSLYLPGDTVWFKGYLLQEGKPNRVTNNLYIDWADEAGEVLECNVYIVAEGTTFGQFVIPMELSSGTLYLNAYTENIEGKGHLGHIKSLAILQPKDTVAMRMVADGSELVIRPRGGSLVAGMSNTVDLRGYNRHSKMPVQYQAELLDEHGEIFEQVDSDEDGLAYLYFTPSLSPYFVRWTDHTGKTKTEPLPEVLPAGVTIDIEQQEDVRIVVRANPERHEDYTLKVRFNQRELFEELVEIRGKGVDLVMADSVLSYGLLQVALLDAKEDSVAYLSEIINRKQDTVMPEVRVLVQEKGEKGRQHLQLVLPEDVATANISVSIVDAFVLPDSTDRMLPALLGNQATDPVVLSVNSAMQSWSRTIPWNREATWIDTLPSVQDELLSVRGQLTMSDKAWQNFDRRVERARKKETNNPLYPANAVSVGYRPVRRDTTRTPYQYTYIEVDEERKILLDGLQVFDSIELRLTHLERRDRFEELDVDYTFKPFADHTQLMVPDDYLIPRTAYMTEAKDNMQEYSASLLTYLIDAQGIDTVRVARQGKAPGVAEMEDLFMMRAPFRHSTHDYLPQQDSHVRKYAGSLRDYLTRVITRPLSGFVRVYLNERLVQSQEAADIVEERDVRYFEEVLEYDMSWIGLVRIMAGARGDELAIYKFEAAEVNRDIGEHIVYRHVGGYAPIVQASNKMYTPESDMNEADMRLTLYWHPFLLKKPDVDTIDIEFFNNDFDWGYWVIIKGMTGDGKLIDYKQKITF